MKQLNENIFQQYSKWKTGYVRKENSLQMRLNNFVSNYSEYESRLEISNDGKINILGDFKLSEEMLIDGKFPFKFGKCIGRFDCSFLSDLVSLEGAPEEVGKTFTCRNCRSLTSLEGAPKKVGGRFNCSYCKNLTSLKGAAEEVNGDFLCMGCEKITSLEGAPEEVGLWFDCSWCNNLTSLKGVPKKIGNYFSCLKCTNLLTFDDFPNEIGSTVKIDKKNYGQIPKDCKIEGKIIYE